MSPDNMCFLLTIWPFLLPTCRCLPTIHMYAYITRDAILALRRPSLPIDTIRWSCTEGLSFPVLPVDMTVPPKDLPVPTIKMAVPPYNIAHLSLENETVLRSSYNMPVSPYKIPWSPYNMHESPFKVLFSPYKVPMSIHYRPLSLNNMLVTPSKFLQYAFVSWQHDCVFLQDYWESLQYGFVILQHACSLPRGRIQEIKCMLLTHLTHGLFLTWKQKYHFIYRSYITIFTRHIMPHPPQPLAS